MAGTSTAELMVDLKGIDFPARKPDLIRWAREHKAKEETINALNTLPDKEYDTMADA